MGVGMPNPNFPNCFGNNQFNRTESENESQDATN